MKPARAVIASILSVVVLLAASCSSDSGSGEGGSGGLTITPEALLKVGPEDGGSWILPNARRITPLGTLVNVDRMPLGIALDREGRVVFVSAAGRGRQSVTAVEASTGEILSSVEKSSFYVGIAVSPEGDKVYASRGADDRIEVLGWDGSTLTSLAPFQVEGYPSGLAVAPDGAILYVASHLTGGLTAIDTSTGADLGRAGTGGKPSAVVVSPDGTEAYVSIERDSTVEVFDIRQRGAPSPIAAIPVQKNPEGMGITADGRRLYVANSDEDSVSVIDLRTRKVVQTIDLRPIGAQGYGSGPNALAISPDGRRLYVAQAADNKVAAVDVASGSLVGAIPTAWYTTAVAVSPDGRRLFVGCGKGTGAGPTGRVRISLNNNSTLQILDIPPDPELASLAARIDEQNTRSARLFDVDPSSFRNPVPLERGGPTPFEHVLVVVRENKTYDALLGDWAKGDGVLENCLYCQEETPNLHALVERFASGDNYYSNAEASIQGHELVTAAIANVYVEKNWFGRGRGLSFDLELEFNPATFPKKEFLFQNLLDHGIAFRVYGEAVGLGPDLLILDRQYVHWGPKDPPWFWQFSKDVDKLDERIVEWERDGLPTLAFMLFPNDHTMGCQFPFPTPRSMVADNDLATGRLLEWLSLSPFWEKSVVFVVEDDPQQGVDHVDAHRSILLVASPYARRGAVSSVHYHEGNLHATIEHILGLPPLTVYDENAQPMWDLFTTKPDIEPFTALPRNVPEEISLPGTTCGQASAGLNFLEPDEAEGLQEILWEHDKTSLTKHEKDWVEGWRLVAERILGLDREAGGGN